MERSYLLDAFDSGWISSRGEYIGHSEKILASVAGTPYAAVCSNGTTALHLALLAIGIAPGDEVIIPSLTYIATLNALYYVGATPIIVDVLDDTWCIDPTAVESVITARTKAIIAVDLYGQPADYTALAQVAKQHGLRLIADAAESIAGSLHGVPTGALADVSVFSFFGNKVITSGEGGAVTTASPDIDRLVRQLRNQGNHPTQRYVHDMIGYNYRMTNLSAAILTAQLERIDGLVSERRRVVDTYTSLIGGSNAFRLQEVSPGAVPTPWMISVRITGLDSARRDEVIQRLGEVGIESRPVFPLIQTMPFVPKEHRRSTPVAELISQEGISLPTFPQLSDDTIQMIVDALHRTLAQI
ncbi:DegT/DnrJ/EryC1/StrS aminotransferase family protein [Microbacterium sp. W4I4]|uniref:DegT/DnrJ/EryC1/StrS family aminotransferase n=1 Tax=Microbacterium sp. W4I4 TaxID=3042295 RepID=UPI0027D83C08|nr:DegT/DnrJ/EryC1/StrS family aminotransferase [Microbacterium sp. W4I4]